MVFTFFNGSLAQHALLANRECMESTECIYRIRRSPIVLLSKNSKVDLILWKFLSEAMNNRIKVSAVFFRQEVKIALVIFIDRK